MDLEAAIGTFFEAGVGRGALGVTPKVFDEVGFNLANGGRFVSVVSEGSFVFVNEEAKAPTLPDLVGLSLTNVCLAADRSSDCS